MSLVGKTLKLKCIVEINLIILSWHSSYNSAFTFSLRTVLKQLYITNKAELFSYKDGCMWCMCIKALKRRAGLGYIINNEMLIKKVSYVTKELKNKAFLSLICNLIIHNCGILFILCSTL